MADVSEPKKGFFRQMRRAVTRTHESIAGRIGSLGALNRTVDDGALEELETVLLTSDMGQQTVTRILEALHERAKHEAIKGGAELRALLKEQLLAILTAPARRACAPQTPPGRPLCHFPGGRQRHR